ncbi:MAG TPA: hypothetical protein VFF55_06230 [Candidatus Deferrimicrobium sp.]|nr:hypothetical protein [Candidatus Deferrimicrobium sp.]
MAIQDGTAGVFVRLPDGYPIAEMPRGRIVQVHGELSAPYGNLEIRPLDAAGVVAIGSGGLPTPVPVTSQGIDEASEGLLATGGGIVVLVERGTGGSFSVTVRDDEGTARVYVHAALGLDAASVQRGQHLEVTGIVGQRASGAGAADGYRLWPRDGADIEVAISAPPAATPRPDPGPPGSRPPRGRPPRARIRDAAPGDSLTIVGTVTSASGLIDSEGRRVTVEDGSGAILVRYPNGTVPARVGTVIRASGEVGTWYDGRQLEAEEAPRRVRQGKAVPTILHRPPEESDEWRLVAVTVRVLDVERDGDTWRAETTLGAAGDLPIVGLSGSGTSADGLEAGRAARIVGIVKRAHPSASDQRLSIAPRSGHDIELGQVTPGETADASGLGGDPDQDPAARGRGSASESFAVPSATLDSLAGLADRLVRVGGRVERIEGRLLTLDDGTAEAAVRLAAAVAPFEPALQLDEVLNVVGRVRGRPGGRLEVLVRTGADVRRAIISASAQRVSSDAVTTLMSAALPEVATAALSTGSRDPAGSSTLPLLPPLAVALAGLAVLLLGGAAVSQGWLRLSDRWRMPGRVAPAQKGSGDPNGTADGVRIGPA